MPSWLDRLIFQGPAEEQVFLDRPLVEGATCPSCGSDDVRRYPIANEHGARIATKCQECLTTLKIERPGPDDIWPPYRAVAYDWPASPSERASRDRMKSPGGEETRPGPTVRKDLP